MASLCTRCALRLRRATESTNALPLSRSLSTTPPHRSNTLPAFKPTSNPELDALLTDFRYKHFLPATLEKPQWNLVFRQKNRNLLQENPQAVNIGGEELQLEHLGGHGVMPNRKKQLAHVMRILKHSSEPSDWAALPSLLRGLHMMGKDPPPRVKARLVRLAANNGQMVTILHCLQRASVNGFTLNEPETLEAVVWGLRQVAERGGWSEEATARAIKDANEVAALLESNAHGSGKYLRKGDPRRSPFVLGVFFELAAVYAWRFKGGRDVDGKVKVFAERLLSNVSEHDREISGSIPTSGPITPMRHSAPILHGLKLADRMLGESMPMRELAQELIKNYQRGLDSVRGILEQSCDKDQAMVEASTYGEEALKVWYSMMADD